MTVGDHNHPPGHFGDHTPSRLPLRLPCRPSSRIERLPGLRCGRRSAGGAASAGRRWAPCPARGLRRQRETWAYSCSRSVAESRSRMRSIRCGAAGGSGHSWARGLIGRQPAGRVVCRGCTGRRHQAQRKPRPADADGGGGIAHGFSSVSDRRPAEASGGCRSPFRPTLPPPAPTAGKPCPCGLHLRALAADARRGLGQGVEAGPWDILPPQDLAGRRISRPSSGRGRFRSSASSRLSTSANCELISSWAESSGGVHERRPGRLAAEFL